MYRVKSESDSEMIPQDQIDSPLVDDGSSGGSLPRGGGPPLKKGPWTSAEDAILVDYVKKHGEGNWNAVQKNTGLSRCGKSCRLRWANHLRPNLKKGAFTPEEEKLIIELHARMGNKWARMAAHLPGRTDNEIKNYWNTRIKRCQRAGLPLYPSNICPQASNEDQHGSSDFSSGEKLANDILQGNGLYAPDFTSDNFLANQDALSYAPQLPAVSISSLLGQSFASKNYGFMDQVNQGKVLQESESLVPGWGDTVNGMLSSVDQFSHEPEKLKQSFGFAYLYGTDPSNSTMAPFGDAIAGSHAFLNGNFSASRPRTGPLKMELPSLQDTETDPDIWLKYLMAPVTSPPELVDSYIQSPTATPSLKSECISPRRSGLLEALLHEAQTLSNVKNQQPSMRSSSSSVCMPCDTVASPGLDLCQEYWEEHADPSSPLHPYYSSSFFNEYTQPVSASSLDECVCPVRAASADESPPSKMSREPSGAFDSGEYVAGPKFDSGETCPHPEMRPDALLGSNWLEESSQNMTDQSVFNGAIAMLLGKEAHNECKPAISGIPTVFDHGIGLDSSWNNMPHPCQMSDSMHSSLELHHD